MFPLPNNEFGFIEVGKVGCVGFLEVRDRTTISQGEKLQKVLTRTPETGLRICGLPCAHPGDRPASASALWSLGLRCRYCTPVGGAGGAACPAAGSAPPQPVRG